MKMNHKWLRKVSAQNGIPLLFLTVALFTSITYARDGEKRVSQSSSASDPQLLQQGKPLTREIAEGEMHSYSVELKAGDFLHVVIRQLGINVAATFIAPDGSKQLQADTPRSTQEAEWITHVATLSGKFTIEVRRVDKGAPTGRYEIEIEEQRKSVAGDDARLSAQKAFTEATRLFREDNFRSANEKYGEALAIYHRLGRRSEEAVTLNCMALSSTSTFAYQDAIERHKEALGIYRDLSDLQGEGFTLNEIGTGYRSMGNYDDAVSSFERALEARRKVGYREGEGETLRNLGIAYSQLGRQEIAIQRFEQSLNIFREVKDRAEEGRTLGNLGLAFNNLSQFEKAVDYYQQALAISRELKDRIGEARALGNLGKAFYDLSRHEEAIEYSEQAWAIFKELKDTAREGIALNNIGLAYSSLGQYDKAIDFYERALTSSREAKDQNNEGRIFNNLGNAYYLLSRYEKATEYYLQALELRRRIKDRRGEGLTLGNLGKAYSSLGQYKKAIEYHEQALTIKREVKDRSGEGHSLNDLGVAYSDLGQHETAITYYEQALTISQEVKDRTVEEDSLWGLGYSYDSLNRYEKANEYYQRSLALSREVKDRAGEGRTFNNLMLMSERQKNIPVAIFYGKQAVNVLQEIRGNIKSLDKDSQRSYLKSHEEAYRKLADLLISQGRLGEAEKVLELLKVEEFNRITRRNGSSDPKIGMTKSEAEASKITDQLASLASERGPLLAKVAEKTATVPDQQRLDLIEATIREANMRITLVLAQVAKAAPDDSLMIRQSQSMMQSLRKLGPGVVALYTVVTDNKGWVILTTPDFRRAYPIDTSDLNKTISDFRLTLKSDRYDPLPLAQKLYGAIFLQKNDVGTTLAGDLKSYGAKTLMWSLDGVLRYVPVGALHDGKSYLVEHYPNVVFTTASLTRLLDTTQDDWRAFGLGVSKQYRDFPALSAVPRELHSIIREAGSVKSSGVLPGVIRLDEQFTRKEMMNGLHEGYGVVHIASHFKFNAESEESSFLLLGDGSYLSLDEMQNSPGIFENVELLTLSACDTATVGANGKEMEGLAFVAQDLGAKAVVASLWPVADVGTEVLMREFYRLKRANPRWSKAEALRQAQIAMLKGKEMSIARALEEARGIGIANEDESEMKPYHRNAKARFAHPHYWAPFILIGNWK